MSLVSSRHFQLASLFMFRVSLVSLDPPLPISLFNMVSIMKDKSLRGYPVKKARELLMAKYWSYISP